MPISSAASIPQLHGEVGQLADASAQLLNNRGRWAEDALLRAAAQIFLPPCILVGPDLSIRHVHGEAGQYLTVPNGQPNFDLGGLIRREFRAELQTLLRQAGQKGTTIHGRPRHLAGMGKHKSVRLSVHPVGNSLGEPEYLVSFLTLERAVSGDEGEPTDTAVVQTSKELEDELMATWEHLQTLIEELETSNEEMQVKSNALEETYADLENIQRSIDYPLLVLDSRACLSRFNPAAAQLFDLRPETIGWKSLAMPGELERFDTLIQDAMRERRSISTLLADDGHHFALYVTPYLKGSEHVRGVIVSLMDETDLFRAERLARESQQQMLAVMTHATVLFAVKDTSGRYEFVNHEFTRLTGLEPEHALGRTDHQLFAKPVADTLRDFDLEVMRLRGPRQREESIDFGGHLRTLLINHLPLFNEEGGITAVCMQGTDITERKHAEEQLRLAARVFEGAAEGLMVTDAGGRILTVNETFSRITGWSRDEALGQTPALLKSNRQSAEFYAEMWRRLEERGWWQGEVWNKRKNGEIYLEWLSINSVRDAVGRVSNFVGTFSDIQVVKESKQKMEFLATHDELTGLPNRALFHDRLKTALARRGRSEEMLAVLFIDLDNFKVINDTPGHDTGDELLLKNADAAMYQVKTTGKSDFQFFSQATAEATHQRLELELGLRRALQENELFLVYQPQVDFASGALVGVEALLRWRRQDGEIVPPGQFIPVAEASLLILSLGDWVLDSACRQMAAWRKRGLGVPRVSVNLSGSPFIKGKLNEDIPRLLKKYHLQAVALGIEVTESTLMATSGSVPKLLRELNLETSVGRARERGFRGGWQGATTPQAGACKEEQRRQATRKPRSRARSGPTQWVSTN